MTEMAAGKFIRVGFGTDLHRLVPGNGLRLGGISIPCAFSPVAVSDGDALIHALVDAVLGAAGLGDIGEHFPESAVSPGQDSRPMLAYAMRLAAEKGWSAANADCVVDLEAVKLGPWKTRIRESLAGILGLAVEQVNVKAKTAEGLGPIGESRAVAAQAVVLLVRGRGDE